MPETRDRDLAQAVHAEIAAIDPPRSCCRSAERAGLGAAARGQARSPAVARLAVRLFEGEGQETTEFDWDMARAHCRASWLRGRFLNGGSLSLGARGAHLEFVTRLEEADTLMRRLEEAGFRAALRVRRGRSVVTWKHTETIVTFLRLCGASASLLELESRLVMRQLQGHLNRVLNAETANLERSVASSARQLRVIDQLDSAGRISELSAIEQAVARERQEAPEANFTELAARLGLSRSRVQRAFQRLEASASAMTAASDL